MPENKTTQKTNQRSHPQRTNHRNESILVHQFLLLDNKTNDDEILKDVADLMNEIRRIAYKNEIVPSGALVHSLIQRCYSSTNKVV